MDSVEFLLWLMAAAVWMMSGFVAYTSFTADTYNLIRSAAGSESSAEEHYKRWLVTRNLRFVLIYFMLTGVPSLIVVMVATRGFKSGFRFNF
jgi:hypothetical protein